MYVCKYEVTYTETLLSKILLETFLGNNWLNQKRKMKGKRRLRDHMRLISIHIGCYNISIIYEKI